MKLKINVIPKSSINKIIKISEDELKIKLTAPPVDGQANRELIKLLSKEYKTAKANISILKGETGKNKIVEIKN